VDLIGSGEFFMSRLYRCACRKVKHHSTFDPAQIKTRKNIQLG